MSDFTVNGVPVLSAVIAIPRVGNWHADVDLDTADMPSSALTIASDDGSLSLVGALFRGGAFTSKVSLRIVGGAGGLARAIQSRFYTALAGASLTLGQVLADMVRDAGETLSVTAETAVQNISLTAWAREATKASTALDALLGETDAIWRVLPDGSIFVGHETWPHTTDFTYDLITSDKVQGRVEIAPDAFSIRPGETFTDPDGVDRKVAYVEHHIEAGSARTHLWFEAA